MTDYLDNDDPINGQKYVCLSILTNKSIKDVSSGKLLNLITMQKELKSEVFIIQWKTQRKDASKLDNLIKYLMYLLEGWVVVTMGRRP